MPAMQSMMPGWLQGGSQLNLSGLLGAMPGGAQGGARPPMRGPVARPVGGASLNPGSLLQPQPPTVPIAGPYQPFPVGPARPVGGGTNFMMPGSGVRPVGTPARPVNFGFRF